MVSVHVCCLVKFGDTLVVMAAGKQEMIYVKMIYDGLPPEGWESCQHVDHRFTGKQASGLKRAR